MKNQVKIILVGCLILIEFQHINAQPKVSGPEAIADIETYFSKIREVHPDMYWHAKAADIANYRDSIKNLVKDSVEIGLLSYWLAQSNHFFDYHTKCLLLPAYSSGAQFPHLEFKGNSLFWKKQKIESINHVTAEVLIAGVKRCLGCDVPWETCCYELNHSDLTQNILGYMGVEPPFRIKMEGTDSLFDISDQIVPEIEKVKEDKLLYDIECFQEDSLAILRYRRCLMSGLKEFHQFLDRAFRQIREKKIKYLFIDVSENPGGNSGTSTAFLKYLYFPEKAKYIYYGKIKNEKNRLEREKNRVIIRASGEKDKFKGVVFIYQSYATRSSGPFLGEVLRGMSRAVLAGTPTEATIPAYSNALWQTLPYSGIPYGVARDYYYKERPELSRSKLGGVLPDIPYPFVRLGLKHCLDIVKLYKSLSITATNSE